VDCHFPFVCVLFHDSKAFKEPWACGIVMETRKTFKLAQPTPFYMLAQLGIIKLIAWDRPFGHIPGTTPLTGGFAHFSP
jgi:hypothetical protein